MPRLRLAAPSKFKSSSPSPFTFVVAEEVDSDEGALESMLTLDCEEARRRVVMPVLGAGMGTDADTSGSSDDASGDDDFLFALAGRGGATCERIAAASSSCTC